MAMRNHALNYCPAIIWWWGQGPKDVGKFTTHPLAGDWSEETIVEALRPLSNIHFEIPDGYLDSEELEALSELTTSFSIRPPKDKDDFDMLPETVHPVPPPSKELLALIGK
ncbi:hypothetical protein DL93DRAFT_2165724 [Clavulina sp. PMI_390]|nr:hypothetical protein DL93DRAFT_2165724 [Clavulina sp. PMI_390]